MLGCVLLVQCVAAIQGFITADNIPNWHATLVKPALNPPNWVFAPVWTILYTVIGLVWAVLIDKVQTHTTGAAKALFIYNIQLAANFVWTFIFFGAHQIGLALIDILALWILIGLSIKVIWPISKPWALALLPYWAWVTFASYLNASLWVLNR